jgi:hypothetical protein
LFPDGSPHVFNSSPDRVAITDSYPIDNRLHNPIGNGYSTTSDTPQSLSTVAIIAITTDSVFRVILTVIVFLLCKRRRDRNIDMKTLLNSGANFCGNPSDMDGVSSDT